MTGNIKLLLGQNPCEQGGPTGKGRAADCTPLVGSAVVSYRPFLDGVTGLWGGGEA